MQTAGTRSVGLKYDLDGNLTEAFVTGDINGDGNVDLTDLGTLLAAYGTCEGQQGYNPNANLSPNDPGPQCIDVADLGVLLSVYGLQATGAIRAKFTWDAENRLVGWEPLLFVSGAKKVEFKYDYLGRRIEKKVYTYNGSTWDLSETRRFIWNNWLLLLELDGNGNVLRKLTWGRDLSGSLNGAGAIGGLLAMQDTNGTPSSDTDDLRYVYFYDANGNVGQVIDLAAASASASIKAHYEYDAYGKVLVQSGSYAAANPYRFSTKPWDDETGLGYWGERYYDPRLGRWISRDPIQEIGGEDLYTYGMNRPLDALDALGRYCGQPRCGNSGPLVLPDPCPSEDPPESQPKKRPPRYRNPKGCCKVQRDSFGWPECCGGKAVICLGPRGLALGRTPEIQACLVAHEQSHIDDWNTDCTKKPDGFWIGSDQTQDSKNRSECKAFANEYDCLQQIDCSKLPNPETCANQKRFRMRTVCEAMRQCKRLGLSAWDCEDKLKNKLPKHDENPNSKGDDGPGSGHGFIRT